MVRNIREVEASMGDGRRDANTEREREQIAKLEVRAIASAAIDAGAPVTPDRVMFRRAPSGLTVHEFESIAGPIAVVAIAQGSPITREAVREGGLLPSGLGAGDSGLGPETSVASAFRRKETGPENSQT